jgi:hypothetical protein
MSEPSYLPNYWKAVIWRTLLSNPNASMDELQAALNKAKTKLSVHTTGDAAADFRRIVRFLQKEKLINERRLQARQRTPTSKLFAQRRHQRSSPDSEPEHRYCGPKPYRLNDEV